MSDDEAYGDALLERLRLSQRQRYRARLVALLRSQGIGEDDAHRIASLLLDAGWRPQNIRLAKK